VDLDGVDALLGVALGGGVCGLVTAGEGGAVVALDASTRGDRLRERAEGVTRADDATGRGALQVVDVLELVLRRELGFRPLVEADEEKGENEEEQQLGGCRLRRRSSWELQSQSIGRFFRISLTRSSSSRGSNGLVR
jgi:hypothetical protein